MKLVTWLMLLGLIVLHHDFWFWSDSTLIGGWLPIGLGWHIVLSLIAAGFWFGVVKLAWPTRVDEESPVDEGSAA